MSEKPDVTMGGNDQNKWKVWQEGAEKNHMDDRRSGCGGNYFDHWNLQRSIFEQK